MVVPIFREKFSIRNCCSFGAIELLEHVMKVVEGVLLPIPTLSLVF